MRHKARNRLTEGPVTKTLITLALPMMVGIIGMVMFNLVDTYFVGRLGKLHLAAMSFTFPVVMVLQSIALGLGIGASAVIARAIGEGDHHKVQRLTTDSLMLSLIIVVVFVVIGLATIEPLFRLLGAGEELLPLIKSYMRIWYIGVAFVVIPMVGNSAIRATGDTVTPSIIMLIAIAVNLGLDPLLIFGIGPFPRLELAGAAIATVIARATTLTISLLVLYFREKMIVLKMPSLKEGIDSWKKILYVALPAGGTNIIIPLTIGVITRFVSAYGPAAVAGFGVGSRIEMFALTPIYALASVLIPFVGQNWGAGKTGRVRQGIRRSWTFSILWGALFFIIILFAARPIAGIFNRDPEVTSSIRIYLLVVSISYGMQGIFMLSSAAFNALNKPLNAAFLALVRMFALYLPLALFGSYLMGLKGLFAGASIANLVTGGLAFWWLYSLNNRSGKLKSMTN